MNLHCLVFFGWLFTLFGVAAQGISPETQPRERLNFNADWHFNLGDPADAANGELDYSQLKDFELASSNEFSTGVPAARPTGNPGGKVSCVQTGFDDGSWRKITLPHDWAIEGPFDLAKPGQTGKLPYPGKGWYRKHFNLPSTDQDRIISLEIDGAMSYSAVWVNGCFVGGWPYGYSSYRLELTPYLKFGGDNVLTIRLDNPVDSSRWYPGSGLYRNVWLTKTHPVHVAHWGTYITTPEISSSQAKIHVNIQIVNQGRSRATIQESTTLFQLDANDQPTGPALATQTQSVEVEAEPRPKSVEMEFVLPHPQLWDIQNPNRYVAVTELTEMGKCLDRYETPFGIRTIRFDAAKGFLLNGQPVSLHGVCGHHDLGSLGAAFNTRAAQRQLEILKEMGVNALRTSHNMPAPELLDLCDKMGIVVMDESFDCWLKGKKPHDYHVLFSDWHERDLRAEYRRDRNHPSIIMWSLGNEIIEQGTQQAIPILKDLVRIAHEEDPTRPVSQGCNVGVKFHPGFVQLYDLFGDNYRPRDYTKFRQLYPAMPHFGSETASTVSSRGEYFFPVTAEQSRFNFQVSSYDLYFPSWATTPDTEFENLDKNPDVAGEFIWTGFDYLGEPTPYNGDLSNLLNFRDNPTMLAKAEADLKALGKIKTPSRSSYFGAVDLAGFKKDRFYLYQSRWRPDLPMAHILPHWNWPDRLNQATPVYVYTSGDEAELFLNGQSQGRQKKGPYQYRLIWDHVVYVPGTLRVVAYKNGQSWAQDSVQTTGPATAIKLEADRPQIRNDSLDLTFLTTKIVDQNGIMVPTANNRIDYEVISGPGEIVATDNGDATDLEIFSQPSRRAFNGMALAILRFKAGATPGDIRLRAQSSGLAPSEIVIHTGDR